MDDLDRPVSDVKVLSWSDRKEHLELLLASTVYRFGSTGDLTFFILSVRGFGCKFSCMLVFLAFEYEVGSCLTLVTDFAADKTADPDATEADF